MLDRMHAQSSFAERRRALDCFKIADLRVDGWFVLQILSLKFDSVIRRRRMQLERDFLACMQGRAAKAGGFSNRMLKLRGNSHS